MKQLRPIPAPSQALTDASGAPTTYGRRYLQQQDAVIRDLMAAAASQAFEQSFLVQYPEDGDLKVSVNAAVARTITSVTTICTTGTATLTVKINTTALGGTANSVSSSEQTQAHASDNAIAAGDDLVLTFSSVSGAENVTVTMAGTIP